MKTIGLNNSIYSLLLTKSLKSKIACFVYNALIYQLRIIVLINILIISTSYQSEDSCINKISTEQYLPVFRTNLSLRLASLNDNTVFIVNKNRLQNSELIKRFYALNGYKPAWTTNYNLTAGSSELMNLIERARYYGLNMNYYNIKLIKKIKTSLQSSNLNDKNNKVRQDFELLLTDAIFKLMIHLNKGLDYSDTDASTASYICSLPEYLLNSLQKKDLVNSILGLQPKNNDYVRLQNALEKYLDKVDLNDEEIDIPDTEGESGIARINAAKVLVNFGYLSKSSANVDTIYEAALKSFQKFHGLESTGKLDKKTKKALSKSTLYRYNQIALNLNRLRNEQELGENFIFVNIPAYKLKIVEKSKVRKVFNVIVGKPWSPTPVMSSKIERIVTNPFWNVPKRISMYEILPQIKKDSSYLLRNRFKLLDSEQNITKYSDIDWNNVNAENFNYYVRQDASRSNALGVIKFLFPNPYHIYLHDTPGKRLFTKDMRAFSHGCIRLQNPDQLAEYIIDKNYNGKENLSIKRLLEKGIHKEIEIDNPLNIHVRYITCEADEQNNIYFFNDIYSKDNKQIEILFN
jgi:murein L,D-transpeptidase YcbB/YkuD